MNLHSIVSGYVSAINPFLTASYQASNGYTTLPDGTRVPAYAIAVPVKVQKQPMQYLDLTRVDGLNISGEKSAFYVSGNWQGVARPAGKGGDLITLPDGTVWLVVMLLENWHATDGWSKIAAVLQNGK